MTERRNLHNKSNDTYLLCYGIFLDRICYIQQVESQDEQELPRIIIYEIYTLKETRFIDTILHFKIFNILLCNLKCSNYLPLVSEQAALPSVLYLLL